MLRKKQKKDVKIKEENKDGKDLLVSKPKLTWSEKWNNFWNPKPDDEENQEMKQKAVL